MYLLRNKEIKKFVFQIVFFTLLGCMIGFFIAPAAAVLVLAISFCFSLFFFRCLSREHRNIRLLSSRIDSILHNDTFLTPEEFQEGDLAILQDEIYKMAVRLHEQSEQLSQDRTKLSNALEDISHQIRTPLTSLYLMTERLKQQPLDKAQLLLLHQMNQMLDRINWLITTLLKMSKLEAGSITYQFTNVKMKDFLQEVLNPMEISMDLRRQTCKICCDDAISFSCDRTWTLEAISNVLKNSLEYTPDGGTLSLTVSQTALYTELCIIDSGTGIPKEDLPHLFERFYRGQNAGRNSFGIGLSLARLILSRENAIITAGNDSSGGGKFTIRFYTAKTI